MADVTPDKLSQRLVDLGLLDSRAVEAAWGDFGTRHVTTDEYVSYLLRKELLTNFQVERLLRGERIGYFYGPYKVLYIIGAGTFARVYRAVHRESGRVAAIKVLRKRFREEPAQREQFLREAQMGVKLRHPNIVAIYEAGEERGAPYMVMEFVEGQNLREMIRVRKTMDVPTSLRLIGDVAAGLAHAGEQGITHRDLKMSNVLVTSTGRAKLVDFGLAAAANRDSEDALADCPNARAIDYATLERGTGVRKDDVRSDLFFAGCILYQMLSGQWPLTETRDRLQRLNVSRFQNITSIGQLAPETPNFVAAIVNRAMEWDPVRRYQTPQELANDTQAALRRLEKGDESVRTPESSAGAARQMESDEGIIDSSREGENRTVMIVESKIEMQDVLRDALKRRGYRVLIIGDPRRALARFEVDADAADCVVFSTPELSGDALDAFNQFGTASATRDVAAILLVDKKQQNIVRHAQLSDRRMILALPLKVRELRAALIKLLARQPAAPPGENA